MRTSAKEAIQAGQKYYFTGIPCVNGHISKRFATNRNCVMCDHQRKEKKRKQLKTNTKPTKVYRIVEFAPSILRKKVKKFRRVRPEIISDRRVVV